MSTWKVQSRGRKYLPWYLAHSWDTGTMLTPQPVLILRKGSSQTIENREWNMEVAETNLTLFGNISTSPSRFQKESIAVVKEVHPWSQFKLQCDQISNALTAKTSLGRIWLNETQTCICQCVDCSNVPAKSMMTMMVMMMTIVMFLPPQTFLYCLVKSRRVFG